MQSYADIEGWLRENSDSIGWLKMSCITFLLQAMETRRPL